VQAAMLGDAAWHASCEDGSKLPSIACDAMDALPIAAIRASPVPIS